ncbi:MAG TPA: sugar phosphate nucleotidyltransferase [Planctomycetota bacterium]
MEHTPWVIVLAAGNGSRLQELTVGPDGTAVPKQFCSLSGGRSLLDDAIGRARHLAPRRRILVVVAEEHERWWRPQLGWIDPSNVVVQPKNRGTVAGLLLPLAHICARDPRARVVVMPSDHHVEEPEVLISALRQAWSDLGREPDRVVLLGIAPDAPETEYGWIVPGPGRGGVYDVAAFVEKPEHARAVALMADGAVWNSFLLVAAAGKLWDLCQRFVPATADAIARAFAGPRTERTAALSATYAELPATDFSRSVLGAAAADLRLRLVPACGWTDLGTPRRVAECVARLDRRSGIEPPRTLWFPTVDLSASLRRRAATTRTA